MTPCTQPVLLVEDNADDVVLMRRSARQAELPCPLAVVNDGERAMAYLAGDGEFADRSVHPIPSLVVLDLRLPRVSGHDVLAWIRGRPEYTTLPVVVLTNSQHPDDVSRAHALGVTEYLVKPLHFRDLVELTRGLRRYVGA